MGNFLRFKKKELVGMASDLARIVRLIILSKMTRMMLVFYHIGMLLRPERPKESTGILAVVLGEGIIGQGCQEERQHGKHHIARMKWRNPRRNKTSGDR
jgi:hypothetical protein